ncbi:unnamed protein product [Tilletia caries]|uniref:Uncharacterized protein n=1 Tax=Tilletia caries TaxID=13290 RepID=A0ABN7IYL3_9BASI|nr:unnamed protein product [Tilletia caries]
MKPGLPFRIVLAKDSKRKIQAAVAYAANLASRFPTDSFQATKLLLAIPCDGASEQQAAPFIDRASVLHGTNVVPAPNNRAACTYQRGNANNTVYSVEELVGVQLFDRPPIWNPDWSHPRLLANTKVLTPISTSARAAHLMDFQTLSTLNYVQPSGPNLSFFLTTSLTERVSGCGHQQGTPEDVSARVINVPSYAASIQGYSSV